MALLKTLCQARVPSPPKTAPCCPPARISSTMSPPSLAQDSRFLSCSPPSIGRSPLRSLGSSPARGSGLSSLISVSPRYKTILHSFSQTVSPNLFSQMNMLRSHALQFTNAIDRLENSLQPMNLLPPEMISRIAAYLIDDAEYYRPLLVATHISRYWRETILGASSLWTAIDSDHPRLAIMCMERSNTACLSVRLRSKVSLNFISNLQLHIARIKTLDVSMPPSDFRRILPQLDPHTMRLESMTLDLNSVYPLPCSSFPPLLSLDVSRLKVLNVRNISFVPTFFRQTNLSKLSIISSDGRLSVLLDVIFANPNLEEILILSRISDLEYSAADIIHLRHLRVLNITLPLQAIRTLLRHVSIPSYARLIVATAVQEYGRKEFLPTLLPGRLDHLQNLLEIETLTYHYSQIANHQTLCGSSLSDGSHTRSHSKRGSFTFRWTAFARFDLVFPPLSLTHVRHLQLNLDCVYSFRSAQVERIDKIACKYGSVDDGDLYPEWRGVFRSLDQLERLTVVRLKDIAELVGLLTNHTEPPGPISQLDVYSHRGRGSERRNEVASTLCPSLPSPFQQGSGTDPPCPSLRTLEFIECHWLCSHFSALLDFVKRRASFTSPQVSLALSTPDRLSTIPHIPTSVSPIRHIHIQSRRPSLLPHSQDIEALKELVDIVVTEVGPQKKCSSRGVESHCRPEFGSYWRNPPLCVVCGTDIGLS